MKELVCNYALIRFLPYRETGEFVNVGVVLYAPETNHFASRLTENRNRRVKAFFPEMDPHVYSAAMESLRRELNRQRERLADMTKLFTDDRAISEGLTAFRAMLRRRETLLHFAEPGMKLGAPQEVLDSLFSEYVLRNFAQIPAYQETVMRTRLSAWLKDWGWKKQYKTNQPVGDAMFHLRLPFVHFVDGRPIVAIKPLDLDRNEPTEVYDHGGLWVQRFRRLAEREHLPDRMVVPLLLPSGTPRMAADDVAQELAAVGVQTADFNNPMSVRELARV